MALGFFRRHQKMVIGIMVALMVAFLVGLGGVNMLLSKDPLGERLGQTRAGEFTRRDMVVAQADLAILNNIGMGQPRYPAWPTQTAYEILTRYNGEQATMAYALLLVEAREAGVVVTEADVEEFFKRLRDRGVNYEELVSVLRAANRNWTEGALRGTIHNWLLINKAFVDASVGCPPSEAEVVLAYRDISEGIDLRVLRLPAEDYLKDVKEPNQDEILAHFNQYRTVVPGKASRADSFNFGYRQPGRAKMRYLLVRGDVIGRVTEPQFADVVDYYNANKSEFVKKVPVRPAPTQPATRPATQPASRPATRPTEFREVPMTFAEAKEQVIEKLRSQAVNLKMEEMIAQAERLVRRAAGGGEADLAYVQARRAMTAPAEKALDANLAGVKVENKPLDEAVAELAKAAGLRAICYPWGTHGSQTLDPNVAVTVKGARKLREALDQISDQAKWPRLHWAMCQGFEGILFSVAGKAEGEGIDFFPVTAVNETPWMTFEDIFRDEVLGYAFASPAGGNTLARTVFSAKGLSPDRRQTPMIEVGAEGSRMYVLGEKPGRMLWRLLNVSPAHVPGDLNDTPGLRRQVVKDIKLMAAFKKAEQQARKMAKAAESVGLETVAEAQEKETFVTGLFPRRTPDMRWTAAGKLELDTPQLQAFVIPKAFAMAPKNVEPSARPGPPAVAIVSLPIKREVLVLERIDFRPIVRRDYEDFGRDETARLLNYRRQALLAISWFTVNNIVRRVKFTR